MKLLIVSTAPLIYKNEGIYAYSPYVNELIIWDKYADEVAFCCPVWDNDNGLLITEIPFEINRHFKLKNFNLNSFGGLLKSFLYSFHALFVLYKAMKNSDHIHLRCPGNVGLLGSVIQMFFPNTPKTAKYAGNWDPNSKQPWSYKLQKLILSNTFLTRNIQVLVYGEWGASTKNIYPFFTATYKEDDKTPLTTKDLKGRIDFVFVGSLVRGKNPFYAIQLVEALYKKGFDVRLRLFGDGLIREELEQYIKENKLKHIVTLEGNQNQEIIKEAFQLSHFVILPSDSEGWPKAIAEGMFWGCVPIATSVSCVPFMLDNENRGVLLLMDLKTDVLKIELLLRNQKEYYIKRIKASIWSRKYTLDVFEKGIIDFLNV